MSNDHQLSTVFARCVQRVYLWQRCCGHADVQFGGLGVQRLPVRGRLHFSQRGFGFIKSRIQFSRNQPCVHEHYGIVIGHRFLGE